MLYNRIGRDYAARRRTDPRIAAAIWQALGDASPVLNVGAGTGSYEPEDREVLAVEPSAVMIGQRRPGAAPVIQAAAEQLPLPDQSFAAAMAVLTVHHWHDPAQGLRELARVATDRIVILTCDPAGPGFWLSDDYFPAIAAQDRRHLLGMAEFEQVLGPLSIQPVLVPRDCLDGFLGAYWARPEAYLDAGVQAGISVFKDLPGLDVGMQRLRADLDSGAWHRQYGALLDEDAFDLGYRLIVAQRFSAASR